MAIKTMSIKLDDIYDTRKIGADAEDIDVYRTSGGQIITDIESFVGEKTKESLATTLSQHQNRIDGPANKYSTIENCVRDTTITTSGTTIHYTKNVASGLFSHAEGANTVANNNNTHAEGNNTTASNYNAHAEGTGTRASGVGSHAEGQGSIASGNVAHAEGQGSMASGSYGAHAEGFLSLASGNGAHSEGCNTSASGHYSHAEGEDVSAIGGRSHAEGYKTISEADSSHAEGTRTSAISMGAHAEGYKNLASGEGSHVEGGYPQEEGSGEVLMNVASGLSAHAEGCYTTASGIYSHAEGYYSVANDLSAHAEGVYTRAYNISSHAEGYTTTASGHTSHAEGFGNMAFGMCSHVEGNNCYAKGSDSHAEGYSTTANGAYSHASGRGTIAAESQTVVGQFNRNLGDDSGYFVVGSGTDENNTANCFRATATNTYGKTYSTSGADYAEMFEWKDKNINNEERIGKFVTLDGNKIKLANAEDDYILGVVSGSASVIGDVYDDQWQGMFVTDIFGRPVYETKHFIEERDGLGNVITPECDKRILKVSPEYDCTQDYVPRSERQEWDAVGLVGKIVCLDDGTAKVNDFVKVTNTAIATKASEKTRFRVMKRIDNTHIQIMIL